MNIYINARFLTQQITGVQRYAIELSRRLRKIHPHIRFIAPRNIIHRDIAEYLEVVVTGRFTGHLWEQVELPLYLKKQGSPYLINLANLTPLVYPKTVITIFDLSFLRNPGWFSKRYYFFYKLIVPILAKKANMVITISEFSKKEIIDLLNIPESRIRIIPCAVADFFHGITNTDKSLNNDQYILALSSIDPRKNFTGLIKAFKNISKKNIKLFIAGSQNKVFSSNELKKDIKENPDIIFTGYVPDEQLPRLYKNAELFIYPSFYEGFGIPPLEAMACGCPTIVSNTSSLPEICGDASFYVNPYDTDDITKGIDQVLSNRRLQNQLISKGYERVKRYSWDNSVKILSRLIKEL
jgi:glycosyltransferase involved in cell wall biosynthesis